VSQQQSRVANRCLPRAHRRRLRASHLVLLLACLALPALSRPLPTSHAHETADLWVLKPVVRPDIPAGLTQSTNPIDAFITEQYQAQGLKPAGPADRRTLLRRVYLDLIGIPPTRTEQDAFLQDPSPDAYEKVVDQLLASPQHAVRYARHWLDVLRYADVDEQMRAAPGIYLWRDWVINALNDDVPYDQFVRAQLTGFRSAVRTEMTPTGNRVPVEPRPDDLFALGFLSRGAVVRDGQAGQELSIAAVETVSTAFMGMTVGCAKCHDHMYDPISQRDFYAMKALFDPLVVRKVMLAGPGDLVARGEAIQETQERRAPIQRRLDELAAPFKKKLYDERVAMLPVDVQDVILKPEKQRTAEEQKIADNYFPVLRIDAGKIKEIMSEEQRHKYDELQTQLDSDGGGHHRHSPSIPTFWTVEVDHARELQKSYILTSGDLDRPETNHEVSPGWPFAPTNIDFREGRVEAFSDWLTTTNNPLFARVAINRIWQWHFGEGLEKTPSDFGTLGGKPSNPRLLDWLASELARRDFSMKQMHRLIVTSDTYKLASEADAALTADNVKNDPADTHLWRFRLQRLEAEPIWDSIWTAASNLDLSVGGPSFDISESKPATDAAKRPGGPALAPTNRRAAYMRRGYSTSADVMSSFLQAFDVDDGRAPCPMRTQTVTAPQGLFMMNSDVIENASAQFAERLKQDSRGNLTAAVDMAYEDAISRPPSSLEQEHALAYLENDPARLKGFAWLLFNLDEFVYVR
jgi:hypothetical protein